MTDRFCSCSVASFDPKQLKVCVCRKKELVAPSSMSFNCNKCNCTGYTTNMDYILDILKEVKVETAVFYFAKGCEGCKFTEDEVRDHYECALASGIENCVYQKSYSFKDDGPITDMSKIEYISDSLSESFIKYVESTNRYKIKLTDLNVKE